MKPGETTKDGRITLGHEECLGACAYAPMMRVDETYHEDLDAAKAKQILDGLAVAMGSRRPTSPSYLSEHFADDAYGTLDGYVREGRLRGRASKALARDDAHAVVIEL